MSGATDREVWPGSVDCARTASMSNPASGILSLEQAKAFVGKAEGYKSLYGSSRIADDFNVANKVYDKPQDIDAYIDFSLINEL